VHAPADAHAQVEQRPQPLRQRKDALEHDDARRGRLEAPVADAAGRLEVVDGHVGGLARAQVGQVAQERVVVGQARVVKVVVDELGRVVVLLVFVSFFFF
jgi:hypothetical protein